MQAYLSTDKIFEKKSSAGGEGQTEACPPLHDS